MGGWIIFERVPESAALEPGPVRSITVSDWLENGMRPRVIFDLPYSPGKNETVKCELWCHHLDNMVTGDAIGASPEDALLKASIQLEKTIGGEWRANLPVSLEVEK